MYRSKTKFAYETFICEINVLNKIIIFIGKIRRLNAYLDDEKTRDTSHSSVLDSWMNRRKGFSRLEQHSDGENEPLDSKRDHDSNNNSDDEVMAVKNKSKPETLNNKIDHKNVI